MSGVANSHPACEPSRRGNHHRRARRAQLSDSHRTAADRRCSTLRRRGEADPHRYERGRGTAVPASRSDRVDRPRRRDAGPARRRTAQDARYFRDHHRPADRCALPSRLVSRRARRGRRRRRDGLRRGELSARHRLHPGADHAARSGGLFGRRQDGREPPARKEHDRRVPSAGGRAGRHRHAEDAAAARARRGARRGHQVRRDRRPRVLRLARERDAAVARARRGGGRVRGAAQLRDQGCDRRRGRTRARPPCAAEPRPYVRPRARGDRQLRALAARRGGRDRHGARRPHVGRVGLARRDRVRAYRTAVRGRRLADVRERRRSRPRARAHAARQESRQQGPQADLDREARPRRRGTRHRTRALLRTVLAAELE